MPRGDGKEQQPPKAEPFDEKEHKVCDSFVLCDLFSNHVPLIRNSQNGSDFMNLFSLLGSVRKES